ncbi:Uncharacterised protein [uncultured archaeon]|nr:Uncharacterised protein [uncultured archaeon]
MLNMQAKAPGPKNVAERAVQAMPLKIGEFLGRAPSLRHRAKMASRNFEHFFNPSSTNELVKVSLVRILAAELIKEAGVRDFPSPEYHAAKLRVRAEIIGCIENDAKLKAKFEEVALQREKSTIFGKLRRWKGAEPILEGRA